MNESNSLELEFEYPLLFLILVSRTPQALLLFLSSNHDTYIPCSRTKLGLVSANTSGLGDDTLHILDLSLAAGEGAELWFMLVTVFDEFEGELVGAFVSCSPGGD